MYGYVMYDNRKRTSRHTQQVMIISVVPCCTLFFIKGKSDMLHWYYPWRIASSKIQLNISSIEILERDSGHFVKRTSRSHSISCHILRYFTQRLIGFSCEATDTISCNVCYFYPWCWCDWNVFILPLFCQHLKSLLQLNIEEETRHNRKNVK